eukprot:gene8002-8825_t
MQHEIGNVFDPPKSRTLKFRVLIHQPEQWKVESIASYKKRKFLASQQAAKLKIDPVSGVKGSAKALLPPPPPPPTPLSISSNQKDGKKKRSASFSNPQGPLPSFRTNGGPSGSSSSSTSSSTGSARLDLTDQQRRAALEQTRKDLDICDYNSRIIQQRIQALHSVKISLLWLLKKASLHERTMIHEGRQQYS